MATLIANRFTSWDLTLDEFKQGHCLTDFQVKVFQNLLSEYATEKVNLKYNPSSAMEFVQREAELQGKITLLEYLLEASINFQTEAITQSEEQ